MAIYFMIAFTGLAIAFTSMSTTNTLISANTQKVGYARLAAESGVSIIRYHLAGLQFHSTVTSERIFEATGEQLAAIFNNTLNVMGQTVSATPDYINIPQMACDESLPGSSFSARLTRNGDIIELAVTGYFSDVERTVKVNMVQAEGPLDLTLLFHGISSKGALRFEGNAVMRSNIPNGSAVMSLDGTAMLPIRVSGSGRFDGDFYMVRDGVTGDDVFTATSSYFLSADGTTYENNYNDHTHSGLDAPPWPTLDTETYRNLATTLPHTTITSETNAGAIDSLHNVFIEANANPTFKNGIQIQGLVYVEWPNNVTFLGSANITGMIVCQGPPYEVTEDEAANNTFRFNGSVSSQAVQALPQTAEYEGLHEHTGTFLLAPDYKTVFNGAMGVVGGALYTSELELNGETTGTLKGPVLVDRKRQFTKLKSIDLYFERSIDQQIPAGFVYDNYIVLRMQASSYEEL